MKSARSKPRARLFSAGAIQTPKLLMLSGIGDRAELDRFGIALRVAGAASANFQDDPGHRGGLWEGPGPLPMRNNARRANLFVNSRRNSIRPTCISGRSRRRTFEVTGRYPARMFGRSVGAGAAGSPASTAEVGKPAPADGDRRQHANRSARLAALRRSMLITREPAIPRRCSPSSKREICWRTRGRGAGQLGSGTGPCR